jgi:hypothetical protein
MFQTHHHRVALLNYAVWPEFTTFVWKYSLTRNTTMATGEYMSTTHLALIPCRFTTTWKLGVVSSIHPELKKIFGQRISPV